MQEDPLLIGVDAGTSVVKAVVFDTCGNERASHECPMPLGRPEPLWIEQDMEQLLDLVKFCLGKVVANLGDRRRQLAGLGITSTGDGTWIIDRAGKPVPKSDGTTEGTTVDWRGRLKKK